MNARALPVLVLAAALVVPSPAAHAGWQPGGVPVCIADGTQSYNTACTDGAGGVIVTWQDGRSPDSLYVGDVYAQRLNASGSAQWTADGIPVCTALGGQMEPVIISDGAGGAFVAWFDFRGSNGNIYAQRIDASGAVLWTADGVALCTAAYDQFRPIIVTDGAGGMIAVWSDDRWGGQTTIYAQRISAAGNVQWAVDGILVCNAAQFQGYPAAVADGAGGVLVAWEDFRTQGVSSADVYAQRINGTGALLWGTGGVAVCTSTKDQVLPMLAPDGVGGAILAWDDYRSAATTGTDIYAQRISAGGAPQWTPNGVAVCTAAGYQYYPVLGTDRSGGAFVTWQDNRPGILDVDVYAQRINSAGAVQWMADGIAISSAIGNQTIPRILPDEAGGAILAWNDSRIGDFDVYAQRIDASGTMMWTPGGVALEGAAGDQYNAAIVGDGAGGAIVAFKDERYGPSADIYAQQVTADGTVPTGVRPPAPVAALSAGFPNPFAGQTALDLTLQRQVAVRVEVFDAGGHRLRTIDMGQLHAGLTRLTFDGRDDNAHVLPSGVYFYRVQAGSQTATRKLVIAR